MTSSRPTRFDVMPCNLSEPGQKCANPVCMADHTTCTYCYMYKCIVCGSMSCNDCVNVLFCEGYPPLPVCKKQCFVSIFKKLVLLNTDNYAAVIAEFAVKTVFDKFQVIFTLDGL